MPRFGNEPRVWWPVLEASTRQPLLKFRLLQKIFLYVASMLHPGVGARAEPAGRGRLELLLFRRGSHPRQHMLEWRSRDPEIATEWVAEGDNQDEHQDAGSGQHSRHCELHPQARGGRRVQSAQRRTRQRPQAADRPPRSGTGKPYRGSWRSA